jgi:hypothetical protein
MPTRTLEGGSSWAGAGPPSGPGAWSYGQFDLGAIGPVTIDGDVTLFPTSANDELWVSPSIGSQPIFQNNMIYATPSNAQYVGWVAPPATVGGASAAVSRHARLGEPTRAIDANTLTITTNLSCVPCEESTWAVAGPNTERLGVVDLGANPYVCSHPPAIGCHAPLSFGADNPPDVIHGLPITGGEIVLAAPRSPPLSPVTSAAAIG